MQQETHFTLAPATRVPRIWTGLWQISSSAWGSAPAQRVRDAMASYVAKGYTAFGSFLSLISTISFHDTYLHLTDTVGVLPLYGVVL